LKDKSFLMTKEGKNIYKQMLFLIDDEKQLDLAKEVTPNFRNVRPKDLDLSLIHI
jgi:hypothetical protein